MSCYVFGINCHVFLALVCGIAIYCKLDSYFGEIAVKRYLFASPIQARWNLFKNYAEHLWAWLKELIKKFWIWCRYIIWEFIKSNRTLSFTVLVFIGFLVIILWFVIEYILPLAGSLYALITYQVDNISIGSRAFRNASLSIGGSITLSIAVLGLILTVIRNILIHKQNKIDEERLVTEQISRAIDQIGNYKQDSSGAKHDPNIEVRLGGLHSLQRIMKNSLKDVEAIAKIFSAYVRENAEEDDSEELEEYEEFSEDVYERFDIETKQLRGDVQVALDIASQFNTEQIRQKEGNIPDIRLNFSYANFSHADFSSSTFARDYHPHRTEMDFRFAILEGVIFSHAKLIYQSFFRARLNGANFSRAYLFNANFCKANLYYVNFRGANLLGADFSGASLFGADLYGANLADANLSKANYLSQHQINNTYGDQDTRIPEKLDRPEHWTKPDDEDYDEEPDWDNLE